MIEVTEQTGNAENMIVAFPTTFKDGETRWEAFPVEEPTCIVQANESEEALALARDAQKKYRAWCEENGHDYGGTPLTYGSQTETLGSPTDPSRREEERDD